MVPVRQWTLSAKLSIVSNVIAVAAVGLAWHGIPDGVLLSYVWHKLLHITGVVIFMGNLIAGPLWLWFAFIADDGKHYAWAARMLSDADIWLTIPGIQLTVWNGVFLAAGLGGAASQPWIIESLVLVVATSVMALVLVLPLQEAMVEAAQGDDREVAMKSLIHWSIWGSVVMIPFTAIAWLMVAKDALFL